MQSCADCSATEKSNDLTSRAMQARRFRNSGKSNATHYGDEQDGHSATTYVCAWFSWPRWSKSRGYNGFVLVEA